MPKLISLSSITWKTIPEPANATYQQQDVSCHVPTTTSKAMPLKNNHKMYHHHSGNHHPFRKIDKRNNRDHNRINNIALYFELDDNDDILTKTSIVADMAHVLILGRERYSDDNNNIQPKIVVIILTQC